jgi:hypothetical protein
MRVGLAAGWAAVLAVWAGAGAAQDWVVFQSPSGNIHCMMIDDETWQGTRCDILEVATMSYPLRPVDCDLDWGHAFEVPSRGGAAPACAGDTVASPEAPVLDYGREVTHGGVTCVSETSGVTCTNRSGSGFTLAKARQRVF